jgi:hypothetical protein
MKVPVYLSLSLQYFAKWHKISSHVKRTTFLLLMFFFFCWLSFYLSTRFSLLFLSSLLSSSRFVLCYTAVAINYSTLSFSPSLLTAATLYLNSCVIHSVKIGKSGKWWPLFPSNKCLIMFLISICKLLCNWRSLRPRFPAITCWPSCQDLSLLWFANFLFSQTFDYFAHIVATASG